MKFSKAEAKNIPPLFSPSSTKKLDKGLSISKDKGSFTFSNKFQHLYCKHFPFISFQLLTNLVTYVFSKDSFSLINSSINVNSFLKVFDFASFLLIL